MKDTETRSTNGNGGSFKYRSRSKEQWEKRASQREAEELREWQDTLPPIEEKLPLRGRRSVATAPTVVPLRAAKGEIKEIDITLQECLLTLLLTDTEAAREITRQVPTHLFDNDVHRTFVDRAVSFLQKYGTAPGAGHLPQLVEKDMKGKKAWLFEKTIEDVRAAAKHINRQFVLDQLQEFVREQELRVAITTGAEELQRGHLQETEAALTKGLERVGQDHSSGLTAGLLTADELHKLEVPPVVDAIYPIIQFPGITFFSGAFASAKTFLALKCVMAIASDQDFFNYYVEKPLSVAFMDFELPVATLQLRHRMVRQTFNGKIDTSRLTYWSAAKCHAEGKPIPNFADPAQIPGLLEKYDKYDVLFIDNLSHAMRGVDMNIAEAYDAMHEFTMQRKFAGKSTVIIQHLGKDPSKGPRGSSRQEDWPDVSLTLKKEINANRNAVIKVTCRKMRNHDESAFEPIEITLGNEGGRFVMDHRTAVDSKSEMIKEEYRQLLEDDLVKRGTQKNLADKYGVDKSLVSGIASKVTRQFTKEGGK